MKTYYIPSHLFNLQQYFDSIGLDPKQYGIKNLELHKEKFFYLIDYLYSYRFTNPKYKKLDFLPLDSQKLKFELGNTFYKSIIKILVDIEFIELNQYYCSSLGIAKEARITPEILKQFTFRQFQYDNERLLNRIDLSISKRKEIKSELIDYIQSNLNQITISNSATTYVNEKVYNNYNYILSGISYSIGKYGTIGSPVFENQKGANKELDYNTNSSSPVFEKDYLDSLIGNIDDLKESTDSDNFYSIDKYQSDLYNIRAIKTGNWNLSRNDLTKRVYSTFTSLSSDLRQFLSFKGEKLEYIDIKNSQPLILGLYLKQQSNQLNENELIDYIDSCCSGQFYNSIMDELGLNEDQRKEFKVDFFKYVLFGKEYEQTKSKTLNIFKRKYPTIYSHIKSLKDFKLFASTEDEIQEIQSIKGYSKHKSYAIFSVLLQRLESKLMIDGVVKKCMQLGIDVIPLHDAIYCSASDLDTVENIILNEFKIKQGIQPSLHKSLNKPVQSTVQPQLIQTPIKPNTKPTEPQERSIRPVANDFNLNDLLRSTGTQIEWMESG